MGDSANLLRSTFSLPHSPPLPLSATIEAATGDVIVTFDRLLDPGTLDALNWAVRADIGPGPRNHTPQVPVTAAGTQVTFTTLPGGLAFPPLGVDYNAAPPDLVALRPPHVAAAAFTDFPIVVV